MKLILCKDQKDLGSRSAIHASKLITEAISEKGNARILLSTGASQFPFFEEFIKFVSQIKDAKYSTYKSSKCYR